jgi:hypothetical protein
MMLAVMTGPVECGVDGDVKPLDADARGKKYVESVEDDDDCSAGKLAGFWLCEFGTLPEGGVRGSMTKAGDRMVWLKEIGP